MIILIGIMSSVQNSNISFTSRYSPIKPFQIMTEEGVLRVAEATEKDICNSKFVDELTDFFCSNMASVPNNGDWAIYKDPAKKDVADLIFANARDVWFGKLSELGEHLTLLVAKDKNNKIQGACLSYPVDNIPFAEDVMYVDSIAVNPKFRGIDLGRKMLKKVEESAKKAKRFTDIYLTGFWSASGFYKKNGYKSLNPQNKNQKMLIDYIEMDRFDYPQYIDLLSKPLNRKEPRWYNTFAQMSGD